MFWVFWQLNSSTHKSVYWLVIWHLKFLINLFSILFLENNILSFICFTLMPIYIYIYHFKLTSFLNSSNKFGFLIVKVKSSTHTHTQNKKSKNKSKYLHFDSPYYKVCVHVLIWWITSPKSNCQSYWLKVFSSWYQFEAIYIYIYIYIVSFSIRTLSHAFSQHSLWPTQNGRFNNHLKYSQFIKSWMKLAIVWFLN